MMFFAVISSGASRRRSSAAPLQSFSLLLFIGIYLMLSAFCQFYHFADVSKMVGNSHPSNGRRTNELKYCFNSHSWALSLIMAWR